MKQNINYSLSGDDILKLLDYKTNIIKYKDIPKYTLSQLLGRYKCCVILYEFKFGVGHWVCIIEQNKNKLTFFDPYGYVIDDEFKFIDNDFKINYYNNKSPKFLLKLLYDSNYKYIDYNNYILQDRNNENITTCGRHVVIRILFKKLDTDQYYKFIKSFNITPDKLVVIITNNIKKNI